TLSGSALGSWKIDPANAHPTGITINPTNVSDIWVVDSGTLKVYQYTAAAGRTSGSQNAAATFGLAAGDTNPQGIADPPPADMLLTPADSLLALNQPTVAEFHAGASGRVSGVAGVPSLAGRDGVFALLGQESLPRPGEPSVNLPAGEALTSWLDAPTAVADRAWTAAGVSGGPKTLDLSMPLTPGSSEGLPFDGSAVDLPDVPWALEESLTSAGATDAVFAGLAEDVLADA